jgi:cytochrome bd-type quinol oxidase subunit 2
MLAYDFPLLSVIFIIIAVAVAVVVVFAIIWALIDNFRRNDHGGWMKALWLILIVILPIIGAAIYYIARPTDAEMSYSH